MKEANRRKAFICRDVTSKPEEALTDLTARLAEMRESNVMHWYNQGGWALKSEDVPKLINALEAVLAIPFRPNGTGGDMLIGVDVGYNQALADVRATIEGKVK